MSTPAHELPEPVYPENATKVKLGDQEQNPPPQKPPPLSIPTQGAKDKDNPPLRSASQAREQMHRLNDDLEFIKAERVASRASHTSRVADLSRGKSVRRKESSPEPEPIDEFEASTNPVHKTNNAWIPPKKPKTKLASFLKKVHESSVLIRYFTYIVPVALILLIPILLAALVFEDKDVGDVKLLWFFIWLMVVWLSLWAGRILATTVPFFVGIIASVFSNSSRKWKDMARMLELPATLFFWWLAVFISFLPTMTNHHIDGAKRVRYWENRMNLVLLSIFVGMVLNLIEKIIIQMIAISFHQRTYEDRIVLNKFQITSLTKLYTYSKEKLTYEIEEKISPDSLVGTKTPRAMLRRAGAGAQSALTKVGDAFGKVAGDFTGRQSSSSGSPERVILTLLQTTDGCQALARRLYRTFVKPEDDNITAEDLRHGFSDEEEADAAFQMFDRDLNNDISCEEMELSIVEIGRERKAIIASLKDLDSVISKLDNVFTVIVAIITLMVFLTIISTSTATLISSASGTALALSWLFSGTAQEFLASIIFVFVKHPFDVGDRVDIINTGAGDGDTFYVKEIALMYTEFRKLQGQVVQAPNSLLNTLFILNMRRSGALAEAVTIYIKFGTTIEQIDELRTRMLEFVQSERREYQGKIITELVDIPDMHSVKLNVVFFYKSNWQNELVRLSRRNKFMCALMLNINAVGIESPNMRWPGQRPTAPIFLQNLSQPSQPLPTVLGTDGKPSMGPDPYNNPYIPSTQFGDAQLPATTTKDPSNASQTTTHSILRNPSTSSTAPRKVDFSLGLSTEFLRDESLDVFEDRKRHHNPAMLSQQALGRVKEEVEENDNNPTSIHHHRALGGLHHRGAGSSRGSLDGNGPGMGPHLSHTTSVDTTGAAPSLLPARGRSMGSIWGRQRSNSATSRLHRWGSLVRGSGDGGASAGASMLGSTTSVHNEVPPPTRFSRAQESGKGVSIGTEQGDGVNTVVERDLESGMARPAETLQLGESSSERRGRSKTIGGV